MLDELADPGRVDHVRLAARDVAQVLRVQEPTLEAGLEHVEDRLPIHACGLHADERHAEAGEPPAKRLQLRDRRAEAAGVLLALTPPLRRHANGCHDAVAVHIEARAALDEDVHA